MSKVIEIDIDEYKRQRFAHAKEAMHYDDLSPAIKDIVDNTFMDAWEQSDAIDIKDWQQDIINGAIAYQESQMAPLYTLIRQMSSADKEFGDGKK